MQIFISYRREDTAGRAGRLFDALVGRFGERDVFQDVAGIAPGADFDRAIDAAIHRSDVVLVIIGEDWATLSGPTGRRLDAHDDYVRREVAAALTSGVPVVPVLVGGATMPVAAQLPDDLAPLARRQAVIVRDDTWHQDIDALVRRLQHEEVIAPRRRRWPAVLVGAALAVLVIGAALALWLGRGDGSGGSGDGSSTGDDAITGCQTPSAAWQDIAVADDASSTVEADGVPLVFTIRSAAFDPREDRLYLDVEVRNEGPGQAPYFNEALFRTVLVDGLAQGVAQCLTVEGDPNLRPGQRAVGLVGYDLNEDPMGRPLVLTLLSGEPQVRITS